jgi:hypothetical protein
LTASWGSGNGAWTVSVETVTSYLVNGTRFVQASENVIYVSVVTIYPTYYPLGGVRTTPRTFQVVPFRRHQGEGAS